MSTAQAKVEEALRRFFSPPNRLTLERILQDGPEEKAGRFQRWLLPLRAPQPEPSLLPCMRVPDQVDWYAVAFTDLQLRTLGEELTAFAGPTYSHFRGERADLDPADPIEAAVLELTDGRAFRVSAPAGAQPQRDLWNALERMRMVRARREERDPEYLRPAGRVLRDFFLALQAGNRDRAEDLLRLLRDRYQLGVWNLLFLRVQMLADLGRWEELLSLTDLGDLLGVRRPLAVTEALLGAVYHQELEPFEFRDDPAGAAEHFRTQVYPKYASLFAYHTGMRAPEVLKSFLLLAVSSEVPDLTLRDEILRLARMPSSQMRYLDRIASLAPESTPVASADPLTRATEWLAYGRYDEAFARASEAPPTPERARLLLQCAYELPALEVRRRAIEAVENLAAEDRGQLLQGRWAQHLWREISGATEETSPPRPPSDWLEWFAFLRQGVASDVVVEMARQGSAQWDLEHLLDTPGAVQAVAEGLTAGWSPEVEIALRNSLPHLLAFFQGDPEWPRRDFLPIYEGLLLLLATTQEGGEDELALFSEVLSALLSLGLSRERYAEAVDFAAQLWEQFPSYRRIDWGLDLLDLLAVHTCLDPESRLRLLQIAVGAFHKHGADRVQPQQWMVFRALSRELGYPEVLSAFPEITARGGEEKAATTGFEALANRSVAIYTLTETAGRRAAQFLKDACPSATVDVCHDHVCSDRLRAAARNADVFIMVTASAKHAATGCIEANRPQARPLLRPTGKGSASILGILAAHLESA